MLAERRRLGIDRFDEVWDGVLHIVPPPSSRHQRLSHELGGALLPLAKAKGLVAMHEAGLYRPDGEETDYRVPDLVYARPEHVSERGVEGRADLVVEVLSPGDETYEKIAFYDEVGVQELLVVDPVTARVELFLRAEDALRPVSSAAGSVTVQSLGVTMTPGSGGRLRLDWAGGKAEL